MLQFDDLTSPGLHHPIFFGSPIFIDPDTGL
jgi:hypothetical protein